MLTDTLYEQNRMLPFLGTVIILNVVSVVRQDHNGRIIIDTAVFQFLQIRSHDCHAGFNALFVGAVFNLVHLCILMPGTVGTYQMDESEAFVIGQCYRCLFQVGIEGLIVGRKEFVITDIIGLLQ